eukprot:tig00000319_g24124.t1
MFAAPLVARAGAQSASPVDKQRLIHIASSTERGKRVSPAERREIQFLVDRLEGSNPTPRPTKEGAELLDGLWDLIYTGPALLDGGRDSWSASGEERPQRPLGQKVLETSPASASDPVKREKFVRTGRAFQAIDVAQGRVQNKVELAFGAGGSAGTPPYFAIDARFAVLSERRVGVIFEAAVLKLPCLPFELRLPLLNRPEGWLDTTFLDPEMRIGRGDKGSIFILTRSSQSVS